MPVLYVLEQPCIFTQKPADTLKFSKTPSALKGNWLLILGNTSQPVKQLCQGMGWYENMTISLFSIIAIRDGALKYSGITLTLRHTLVYERMNYCELHWTKASAKCKCCLVTNICVVSQRGNIFLKCKQSRNLTWVIIKCKVLLLK